MVSEPTYFTYLLALLLIYLLTDGLRAGDRRAAVVEEDGPQLGERGLQHVVQLRLPQWVAIEVLEGHGLPADGPILQHGRLDL